MRCSSAHVVASLMEKVLSRSSVDQTMVANFLTIMGHGPSSLETQATGFSLLNELNYSCTDRGSQRPLKFCKLYQK